LYLEVQCLFRIVGWRDRLGCRNLYLISVQPMSIK